MKILICAAGTGGHIYPAITLAKALESCCVIDFIGSYDRLESILIPQANFNFIALKIKNKNESLIAKFEYFLDIFRSFLKCLKIIKEYDVVIGFGNYISVPVILSAKFLNKKIYIHEQNVIPGKANLFLAKFVDAIFCSFEDSINYFKSNKCIYSGNPQSSMINYQVDDKYFKSFNLKDNLKTVLVFFGSLGSMTLDGVMQEFLKDFKENYQIIYATGSDYITNYHDYNNDNVRVVERVDSLKLMPFCDLIVARSGATTVSEISALKIPSLLIPSPYVANNHQHYNAKMLSDKNATIIIEEKEINSNFLKQKISEIINNDIKLNELKTNVSYFNKVDALEIMSKKVLEK